jgi:hypothetical protein
MRKNVWNDWSGLAQRALSGDQNAWVSLCDYSTEFLGAAIALLVLIRDNPRDAVELHELSGNSGSLVDLVDEVSTDLVRLVKDARAAAADYDYDDVE